MKHFIHITDLTSEEILRILDRADVSYVSGELVTIAVTHDLGGAVGPSADVICTDCWPKSGDRDKITSEFLPYQVNGSVLDRMNPNGFFLPCPPVTRGEEVSEEAMRSSLCADYAAKECLLHAQNAIMEWAAGAL